MASWTSGLVRVAILLAAIVLLALSNRSATRAFYGPQAPDSTSAAVSMLAVAAVLLAALAVLAWFTGGAEWAPGALASGFAILALLRFAGDWHVANVLTIGAMLSALVALVVCGADRDRAPDGRGLRVGAALGLVSAGGAVVAGASFDASTNDFGPWTPYGEGTWTVIGGLSVVAGVVLVRSRPRQWFIPAPALAMGAYGLYHTWIAFPIDGIDLTIFIGGPLLVVVWLMTAVATWAWASDVPTADSVRSDGPASP